MATYCKQLNIVGDVLTVSTVGLTIALSSDIRVSMVMNASQAFELSNMLREAGDIADLNRATVGL